MRRIAITTVLLGFGFAAACQDDGPTAPTADDRASAPGPSFEILDAAHGDEDSGFYFLPPLVPPPSTSGVFVEAVNLRVEICASPHAGEEGEREEEDLEKGKELERLALCSAAKGWSRVVLFTTDPGSGGETIHLANNAYQVNWHARDFDLDPTRIHRIFVRYGHLGDLGGHADVQVAASGNELRNIDTDEYVPLMNNRTLAIRFTTKVPEKSKDPPGEEEELDKTTTKE